MITSKKVYVSSSKSNKWYKDGEIIYQNIENIVISSGSTKVYYLDGSIEYYNIEGEITKNDISNYSNAKRIEIGSDVTSLGDEAFQDCSSLTSVEIGSGVTAIANAAFTACISLTSVTIPNSVTSIGNYAFNACSGLTSVTIPNSVTSIGYEAFMDCKSLSSITIPNSVTSISGEAFYNCGTFTITFDGTESEWNSITKGYDWNFNCTITMVYLKTAEYTDLDYLTNEGKHFFYTPYYGSSTTKVIAKYNCTGGYQEFTSSNYATLFGTYEGTWNGRNTFDFQVARTSTNSTGFRIHQGTKYNDNWGINKFNQDMKVVAEVGKYTIYDMNDNVSSSLTIASTFSGATSVPFSIFAATQKMGDIGDQGCFNGKLYYIQFYNGDTLVHNYVPKLKTSTNTQVLYDTVTQTYIEPYM